MKKKAGKSNWAKTQHYIQTSYLDCIYGKEFPKTISRIAKKILTIARKHPFDAIAFSGSSGAAVAYPLSYLLKIPLIHVRRHMGHYDLGSVEGTISSRRYLIVDDFIESGATINRIIKEIKKYSDYDTKPVAICLYNSSRKLAYKNIPVFGFWN